MTVAEAGERLGRTVPSGSRDRRRLSRQVGLLLVLLALATSTVSFLVLTGETRIQPSPSVIKTAAVVDGAVVLMLTAVVAYEAVGLWLARRRGRAAARLHVRIVTLFSIIAALPAILMAVIASITLDKGLDRWFSERTQAIIETSRTVSQAYVQEHSRVLALDLLAIANEFNRVTPNLDNNSLAVAAYLSNQAQLRGLSAIQLIHRDKSTIVEGETSTNYKVPPPPDNVITEAEDGQPSLISPGTTNLIGGVLKLTKFDDVYLYLARPIDARVTRYLRLTEENAAEYQQLQSNRFGVQIAFAILFVGMALVVLLSAIWLGISFADSLVAPIRRLISAADEISEGNLDVHVPVKASAGDIGLLGATFNTMTSELKSHRNDLLAANQQMDERRRFTEAVLSGVSAGVIGLDSNMVVTLANRSALDALKLEEDALVQSKLADVVPELEPILDEARARGRGTTHGQIQVAQERDHRTFNVQVTQERSGGRMDGLVVTLDDITDLVSAQRRSAWADVARRIAHEIKNPLTPIQLSAERLRRRFGPRIAEDDRRVFDQCTDTIVRQVGDIRRMVDEFSSFARMPKPIMESRDLREVVKEAVFLQEVGNPNIRFDIDLPEEPVLALIDSRLMTQALTNIVKNATEAIEAADRPGGGGVISVHVSESDEGSLIEVEDDGKGLPVEDRERLLEPYMTTREKGTGLGLAIVRKIMEEQGGTIALTDARAVSNGGTGAMVRLTFPHSGGEHEGVEGVAIEQAGSSRTGSGTAEEI
ncbi:PAS/PAC sensor signal transduction histidine kinase [Faunimonas pinastri]|uniref:histidine kinase n=1 Tax=Faunimonas pinastri TaxID=1855383 RepID=A0A1H9N8E8_9HYPH|nr:PAS domain-containing sensor histidine kinase [Faunimonas pinastri]SER31683.1 PAS/PAC sensor signal transduction histidine kinase [Faunimonas pinastri]